MAEQAQHIELVIRDKGLSVLLINGEEFPWHITSDGLELTSDVDGVPVARVAILAKHISTRFESAPSDPVPEGDPNFFDQHTVIPNEGEWTVGWRFNIEAVDPPPSTVLALRQVEDEDDIPYLVRANEGNWNAWSWASGPFEEPNPDYTHLWRRLVEMHDGQTFEVARTRGDDSDDVRPVH